MQATITAETIQKMRETLGAPQNIDKLPHASAVEKAINQATGLVWFDLQAPALSLFPVLTPLRNFTPRVGGDGGTAVNWRQITGINTTTIDASVSEGNRGAVVTTAASTVAQSYKGLGLEDYVTFEADYAAQNFQDVKATAALNLLRALMIQEEFLLLAGNTSVALGTTPTPTVATATTGGGINTGLVVSVICVALTADGFRRSSVAAGIPAAAIARTNADSTSDNINPGVAIKSAGANVTTGAGTTNSVTATVTAVSGAVGYAWFWSTVGNERLGAITTINSVLITVAAGTGTQLASSLSGSDLSQNALAFDGLVYQAFKSGSNAYIATQPTGTAGVGTPLTSDAAGGIVEFTTMFADRWDNFRLSPTTCWVNRQELTNLTKKIVANSGAPLIRYTEGVDAEHSGITGGAMLKSILNPITQTMIPVKVHPNLPPGTIVFTSETIPYPLSGVGNVYQVKTRREYYQLEWPLRTRKYEYGVYADELLQHYFPPSMAIITNIANG